MLINERYEVVYFKEEGDKKVFKHSICFPFNDSEILNRTSVTIKELQINLKSHIRELNFSKYYYGESPRIFQKDILNSVDKDFYIFNFHTCLTVNLTLYFQSVIYFNGLFKLKYFSFKDTHSVFYFRNTHSFSNENLAIKKSYPYSDCYAHQKGRPYTKFDCVNDCLMKKSDNVARNLLTNKIYLINLKYDKDLQFENQKICFKNCKESCEIQFPSHKSNYQTKFNIWRAYPKLSDLFFYIQILGLTSLLANFSFLEKFPLLVELIHCIFFKNNAYNKLWLQIFNLILSLVLVSFFYFELISNFKHTQNTSKKREIISSPVVNENFTFLLCVDSRRIMNLSYQNNYNIEKRYANLTLAKIEKLTESGLSSAIDKIYLYTEGKKEEINYEISKKVIFVYYYSMRLQRCWKIMIFPTEEKIQSLLSISKLRIELKSNIEFFYLLFDNVPFTSNTQHFSPYYDFDKKVLKRSKTKDNCLDYNENMGCKSRYHCVDKCISRNSMEKGFIDDVVVIYKEFFNDNEWLNFEIKINRNRSKVKEECLKEYYRQDCTESYFSYTMLSRNLERNVVQINLHYKIITIIGEEPSIKKLVFDMITVQSFIIGLNILKVFGIVISVAKIKLNKIKISFILLFCLFGFTVHLYFLIDEILYDALVNNQYYDNLNEIEMSELILCFEINPTLIDLNQIQTGDYLNSITQHINFNEIFNEIRYLNEKNDWIASRPPFSENNKSKIRIKSEIFFFFNTKCFLVKPEIKYVQSQFLFENNTDVLKIFLNQEFLSNYKNFSYFFFLKKPKTISISQITKVNSEAAYLISEEFLEIIFNDKFSAIKNPLSLFYEDASLAVNDVNVYFKNIMGKFKNSFNAATDDLPLKKSNFKLELNNDLFHQYNIHKEVSNRKVSTNENFKKYFIIKRTKYFSKFYLNLNDPNDVYDFKFSIHFLKKGVYISNQDNYPKLFLTCLNIFSIWFNVGLLDLSFFVFKVKLIFIFIYKLLLKSDILLQKMFRNL